MYLTLGNAHQLGTLQVTAGVSTGLATAAAVDPEPISKAILAIGAGLASLFHIGAGCGQACVTSAATEQIFEAAADNVYYAAHAGMLTRDQAVQGIQWLQQQGDIAMQELAKTDSKAVAGQKNMDAVLADEIRAVQEDPVIPVASPTMALDPYRLQASIFIQPGTGKWYRDSVTQGQSLALQAIAQVTGVVTQAQSQIQLAAQAPAATAPVTSPAGALIPGFSNAQLLIAVGVLGVIGFALFTGRPKAANPKRRRNLARKVHARF